MKKKSSGAVKIRRIRIVNYKGIDELEIEFPGPKMSGDTDASVMGSRNGLGKTSVLECCALLLIGVSLNPPEINLKNRRYLTVDLPGMIIRAGASAARLEGDIVVEEKIITSKMEIDRSGNIKIDSKPKHLLKTEPPVSQDYMELVDHFVSLMTGRNPRS